MKRNTTKLVGFILGRFFMQMIPKSLGRISTKGMTPEEIEDVKYMKAAIA